MPRPLTEHDLLPDGPLERLGRSVHVAAEMASTNRYLLEAAGNLPDGAVAWTEYQSAGRGRLGRRWLAPRGSSILLSVLLREPADSPLATHATVVAALAACEAVEARTDCRPAVRWPNDLVIDGKKLGGVLAESTILPGDSSGCRAVALGIGLNCLQHEGHFDGELRRKATSLDMESGAPIDRAQLASGVLRRLDTYVSDATDPLRRAQSWRAAWLARCEDLGARVALRQDGCRYAGTILEVADSGDLVVQLDEGGRRNFESTTTTRLWQ